MFASPGGGYLQKLGEMVYAVSSLEWTLLGDLTRLAADLPGDLNVGRLSGATTGQIAQALSTASASISAPTVATYILAGGEALAEVAKIRNAVLHARPATIDNEQRLVRWRASPAESYVIADAWLDDALRRIAELAGRVNAVRPPLPESAAEG